MRASGGAAATERATTVETTRTKRTLGGAIAGNRRSAPRSACSRGKQCASHAASFVAAPCAIMAQSGGMAAACCATVLAGTMVSDAIMQACARLMNWAERSPKIVMPASQRRKRRATDSPTTTPRKCKRARDGPGTR